MRCSPRVVHTAPAPAPVPVLVPRCRGATCQVCVLNVCCWVSGACAWLQERITKQLFVKALKEKREYDLEVQKQEKLRRATLQQQREQRLAAMENWYTDQEEMLKDKKKELQLQLKIDESERKHELRIMPGLGL